MGMLKLILVRHGETAWNREKVFRGRADIPLSQRGLRQAELTGKALRGCHWLLVARPRARRGATSAVPEVIYTSPLQRSLRTAEAIARETGSRLISELALADIDFGEWTGLPQAHVKERFPELYKQWKSTPHLCQLPGGERLEQVWRRAGDFAHETVAKHQGTVVIVTHRVVLKALILSALGLGPEHFWIVRMDTCSISALEHEKGRMILTLLNDTHHLADATDPGATDF